MSQKYFYACDGCNKPTGEKPHITLMISAGNASGIALPPNGLSTNTWRTVERIGGSIYHFHDGKCIGSFFDAMLKRAVVKAK